MVLGEGCWVIIGYWPLVSFIVSKSNHHHNPHDSKLFFFLNRFVLDLLGFSPFDVCNLCVAPLKSTFSAIKS